MKSKSIKTELPDILKNNGFKSTGTRISILGVFTKNDKPITADFIFKKLKGEVNEVTVYRTLSSFEEVGIIKKVDLRRNSICFELNDNHHHHIVCNKCGQIEDFKENKGIEKILAEVINKSKHFKSIKEHSLELFGFCKECN